MRPSRELDYGDAWGEIAPSDCKEFAKHVRALNRLIARIRQVHPEAQFYLANDTLNLMIGDPQEGHSIPHQERVVCAMCLNYSDGGRLVAGRAENLPPAPPRGRFIPRRGVVRRLKTLVELVEDVVTVW